MVERLLRVADFLHHIAINLVKFQFVSQFREKFVVEVHNLRMAPIVMVEGGDAERKIFQFLVYMPQDIPVAATPAVDALLDVAHQHTVAARSKILNEELLEIAPLQA